MGSAAVTIYEGYVGATAAALALGVTRTRIYQFVHEGKLNPKQTPLGLVFSMKEIAALDRTRQVRKEQAARRRARVGQSIKVQEQVQRIREMESKPK